MTLGSIIDGLAFKTLVQVDLPNKGSHQHELNGSRALGKLLGFAKLKQRILWIKFSDTYGHEYVEGEFTWYDAREKSSARTGRSEWRFYYTGSVLGKASVGDKLIIVKPKQGTISGLIFAKGSANLRLAQDLFGISERDNDTIEVLDQRYLSERPCPQNHPIIKALGVESVVPQMELPIIVTNGSELISSDEFKFRPASRLIATIGQDLIKDPPAAIIELVKNSYDADSSGVELTLRKEFKEHGQPNFTFRIADNGHGMSYETVIHSWLVPATPHKSNYKYSPLGRRMQGNKGIGRYASFVLGNELLLKTIAREHEETSVFLDWNEFTKHRFLDEVPVIVEKRTSSAETGTTFEISGSGASTLQWNEQSLGQLRTELRKLISPFRDESDPFKIVLNIQGFDPPYENFSEQVEPLSLVEFFDYRLSGTIKEDGVCSFIFENQVGGHEETRDVVLNIPFQPAHHFGAVEVDLRVYDRDPDAIDELIARGLRDPESGSDMGKREARSLLDSSSGIALFRGDFKIRPYGDPGFDWLELDKQRVQNPSLRIGSNQIIGFVRIQPEELSHLEEKSARDGLKEDGHYLALKNAVKIALAELEQRRFVFRKKLGRGRKTQKVEEVVNQLTDFESAIVKIEALLEDSGVPETKVSAVRNILEDTKREKEQLVGQIRETIAIYQGQATLGKIIMVLLHEGRKPIGYFRDMAPILGDWIKSLRVSKDDSILEKLLSRLVNVHSQAGVLTKLFDRLEPLSVRKRHKPRKFMILEPIRKSADVFHGELEAAHIRADIDQNLTAEVLGWEEDAMLIFTNLIENSIHWLKARGTLMPHIAICLEHSVDGLSVVYSDNGPGISKELILDQSVFEPGFSTKKGGTGLGLAIAGEAADRNGWKLKAHFVDHGAKFVLDLFPGLLNDKTDP